MNLLFVSGTTGGGSGRSQRELAKQLMLLGAAVTFIVDDKRSARTARWVYGHMSDLSVRLDRRLPGPIVAKVRDSIGTIPRHRVIDGLQHATSPVPQNAAARFVVDHRPNAVVVNSVERWAWRRLHALCQAEGIPTILYIREEDSLEHLTTGAVPTILIANAESLAQRMRDRGFECAFIPSVVDTAVTRTRSTRKVALAINPIPSKGVDLIWTLADELPDIDFVVQESWPLAGAEESTVQAEVARRSNVVFRRRSAPGPDLYSDARALLVPYRMDSRPRVILEAQANGIPVIVGDVPALCEAIGAGGLSVALDAVPEWVAALRSLWDDGERYAALADSAFAHGNRTEVTPAAVARGFQKLVNDAVVQSAG